MIWMMHAVWKVDHSTGETSQQTKKEGLPLMYCWVFRREFIDWVDFLTLLRYLS